MRKTLGLAFGAVLGACAAGAFTVGVVLLGVHLYLEANPPNGNDFQYLGLHLFAPIINGIIVVCTIAGAIVGGLCGYGLASTRP